MSPADVSTEEPVPERHSDATTYPDMWVDPDDDPRSDGGFPDERSMLIGYLRDYRLTLQMKCDGLDAEQLARRSVPPSTMSLLGLIRHMAYVEHHYSDRVHLMVGEREIVVHDRDLAARILNAAGGQ